MNDERFSRIEQIIGPRAMERLHSSFVVIAGLGAVGSYAVEALARAGIGRMRLVDFDRIRMANINRQIFALDSTLGKFKADVAADRVRDINPRCRVEIARNFIDDNTAPAVIEGNPTLLIDAIDSLNPKTRLLAAAIQNSQPVISSMGAALRTDPSLVRTGPLSQVVNCPLARLIRRRLRKQGLPVELACVYSVESIQELPRTAVAEADEEELFPRGRRRQTLGSLPTLTGIFGLTAANMAIHMIARES